MKDTSDPEKGWVLLIGTGGRAGSKGKGKSGAGDGSLKAEGVKDNAVLAFRWGVSVGTKEAGEEDMDIEDEGGDEDGWDVAWPKYEDTYIDGLDDEGIAE